MLLSRWDRSKRGKNKHTRGGGQKKRAGKKVLICCSGGIDGRRDGDALNRSVLGGPGEELEVTLSRWDRSKRGGQRKRAGKKVLICCSRY